MTIHLKDSEEYGPYLQIDDLGIADALDDYLGAKEFVLYNVRRGIRDQGDEIMGEFYFGRAASCEKIEELLRRFEKYEISLRLNQ